MPRARQRKRRPQAGDERVQVHRLAHEADFGGHDGTDNARKRGDGQRRATASATAPAGLRRGPIGRELQVLPLEQVLMPSSE